MHAVAEAKAAFRAIPRGVDQPKLEWLRNRVAPFFGLTFSQAKKIEYDEVKDLRASRLDHIRDKVSQLQESAAKRRGEADAIKERLACLRSARTSRIAGGCSGGIGTTDSRGLGAGEGSSGESGRTPAIARPDEA
ncbi:hypothetical protein RSO01_66600 [Reyranella soli]|uniref:Uncharacterized protein n=2 Tax=Reyranella soli TaxID=1230389 RepID=A0A512NKL3_9HYPH|nr:hypothetical protein RSO01_66600 [Reyranella soli]